jgi:hypothetical protein
MKAVFLPTDWTGEILLKILKLTGNDISNYFNIATVAPETLSQGQEIWSIDGTPWTVPVDLYLTCAYDYPVIKGTPIGDVTLSDLLSSAPMLYYCATSPDKLWPVYLPLHALSGYEPARSNAEHVYIPQGYTLIDVISASRYTDFPAWSRCTPVNWYLYQSCEYVYDEDFRKLHISLAPGYYDFDIDSYYLGEDDPVRMVHSGHGFLITSCNESLYGFPVWTETDGYLSSTNTQAYQLTDKAWFFAPGLYAPGKTLTTIPGIPPGILGGISGLNRERRGLRYDKYCRR